MKITGMEVDGYGVWNGLKLEGLADGLNVLYGPNEAGKTTLLQFVRSILYGLSPQRRKYLPAVRGGRPGGSIDLAGPSGNFQLQRHDDPDSDNGSREHVALTAADGTRQGEHLLKVLLCDVDEAIYNNVFAVGLREMQELGVLGDTQAAELLYSLTAGLDRVSLVEVIRELQTSRNRILDPGGGPSQVVGLIERREKLRSEIEELAKLTRRYGRLAAQRNQLDREVVRLEEENNGLEHQARVAELAITLSDRWARRAALDDQLAALGPATTIPEGVVDRLDALGARLQKHQRRLEQLDGRRQRLRSEAADLPLNEALWRQSARIEALAEQESWMASLRDRVGELETETAELQASLADEQGQLGLGPQTEDDHWPAVSRRTLPALRPAARALRQCRRGMIEARREATAAEQTAESLSRQLAAALSGRGESDLAAAIDGVGNRVAQLRRRLQADERLDEMDRYQRQLQQQSRRLVGRGQLPVWVLLGLGAVFALGVTLVMAGLLMPTSVTGTLGWSLALLGLAGSGLAGAGKVLLERSNARQLETCQRQIEILQSQIRQAQHERDALNQQLTDQQLTSGGGPVAGRLQAAQRELAELEELAPLDARLGAARQETHAAAGRVNLAAGRLAEAVRRWRAALADAGLPEGLSPGRIRRLMDRSGQLGELRRRLDHRREELHQRRHELDSLLQRIARLVADGRAQVSGDDPLEQIRQLRESLAQQETAVGRRDVLRRQARQIRRRQLKHRGAVGRLRQRRRELLRDSDCKDEQEFRQRALQAARAKILRQQRDALDREITAAIGGSCPEQAVGEQLNSESPRQLETRRDELLDRLASAQKELKQRFQRRGELAEQLRTLAEDRQMADRQLELATLKKRLQDAIGRWQVLAVTGRVLQSIRTTYEQQRQPETLQEASGYLDRLTRGRYRRVWTPLGEDVLLIDDAEGNRLTVEMLSRGTREQLFLALRLALAASYARRGAVLPLVLDDVLVNFDADRAKAAAAVLRDFAAAGHQLLVFTCHQHIFKLFRSLKVPVSSLPDNSQTDHPPITFDQPAGPKRKRTKKADPPPEDPPRTAEETTAVEEDEQHHDEIAAIEHEQTDLFNSPDEEDPPWDEQQFHEPEAEHDEEEEEGEEDKEGDEEEDEEEEYEEEEYEEGEEDEEDEEDEEEVEDDEEDDYDDEEWEEAA